MAAQAAATVRAALEESIDRHLVSDVPVGVFLSGGIDSTILVALASQRTKEPLRTFSISFDDPAFDEGGVAARTAAHFGAKHTDWRLDPGTAKRLLHEFLERSDQPSVDGFNTFCVAKMAHENDLKVVLSGLGGDEVFGGYPSFRRVPFLMRKSRRLLGLTRSLAGMWLKNSRSGRARRIGWFLSGSVDVAGAYECIRGIFTPLEASELLSFYGVRGYEGKKPARKKVPPQPTIGDQVSYLELTRYMRNQLLRDSDVMSMAWSLELRVPFADRKLIETVARIPAKWRLAPGKRILLDAVPEIPEWVRKRPKQGFAFPFRDWIKSEWGDIFARIQKESPVPTRDWYRTWCLFALENFLERLKAESKS
jgi:asparagine synthase (glutamine-hydrolysing)